MQSSAAGVSMRQIIGLLLLLTAAFAVVELVSRFAVTRISKITRRVDTEYKQAIAAPVPSKKNVLFLGNSLLDAAINVPEMAAALGPELQLRRLMIEQTSYLDWYYGMRKLFAEGARPDVVVLFLTARNLVSSDVRGEYFALHLLRPSDVPDLTRRLDLHPTEASNMGFATASHFYGMRSELRKVLLSRLMPDLRALMALITLPRRRPLRDEEVQTAALARLLECKRLAERYGSSLVFVMPPLLAPEKSEIVATVGEQVGVPVIAQRPASLTREHYTDGYHLSPAGAEIYTSEVAPVLREVLTNIKNVARVRSN